MTSKMVAAVYARKSTAQESDAEDRSVARQVANAREFAKSKGWTVDDAHIYIDDGISGAEVKKLVSKQRMLKLIHSGDAPFQVLVIQAQDRLSRRDGDEAFAELKAIARAGVEVWFYSERARFEYGTMGKNLKGILYAEFAAEFRRDIARKTQERLRWNVSHGYVAGGAVFGYDNVCSVCDGIVAQGLRRCCRNGHTERRINATEAPVIVRANQMYAAGSGLPTIAHTLNAEAAPAPRAQRGRVGGWCPASVRELLRRPLYRGEIVHGRLMNLDADESGNRKRVTRPESEWLRVQAPHLRIVPQELADAVDARRASMLKRSLRQSNGRLMGRPPGEGSPYLLTGLLTCGTCGGSMEVLSTTSGKRRTFHYRCSVNRRKGSSVCTNKRPAPMADADAAVLEEIKRTLLHPKVVERALAHAERSILRQRSAGEREAVEAELNDVKRAMRRLSAAIAKGGELDSLVAALETHERERAEIESRLEALRAPQPTIDPADVRQQLHGYLKDWQRLLMGHVGQAQQVLRRLVIGRLTFTPHADGYYAFSGKGTVEPLLGGIVRKLASPMPASWNHIVPWLRQIDGLRRAA